MTEPTASELLDRLEIEHKARIPITHVGDYKHSAFAYNVKELRSLFTTLETDAECLVWVAENFSKIAMFSSIFGFHADLNKDRDPQEFEWWLTPYAALCELYRLSKDAKC